MFYVWAIGPYDIMICPFLTEEPFQISLNEVKPIELTEEWLIKFGFKKMNYKLLNKIVFYSETWDIEFSDNEFYMPDIGIVVKYVHQLQNLYFALTNEELSI